MHVKKIVLAGLMALLLLSIAATTASALRSLEASQTVIKLLSTALTFNAPELGVRVICSVGTTFTLRQRSYSKGEKVLGSALFRILNRENRCEGGIVSVVGGPFEVKYLSFIGTLPRIEGLNLQTIGVAFLIEVAGLSACQYTTNVLGFQRVRGGVLEELRGERANNVLRLEARRIRELPGSLACAREFLLESVFLPQERITLTLT